MNSVSYAISGRGGNAGNGNVFFNDINNLPFPFPWERPFLKFPGTGFCCGGMNPNIFCGHYFCYFN